MIGSFVSCSFVPLYEVKNPSIPETISAAGGQLGFSAASWVAHADHQPIPQSRRELK